MLNCKKSCEREKSINRARSSVATFIIAQASHFHFSSRTKLCIFKIVRILVEKFPKGLDLTVDCYIKNVKWIIYCSVV